MFAQQIFNGLSIGMAYALVAVGYSLVFGILRLINFSHGSVYAFGAMMTLFFVSTRIGIIPAIIVSALLSGIVAALVNKWTLEPLRLKNSSKIASLITTIGVSNVIQNMLIIVFGSQREAFPAFMDFGSVTIGNSLVIKSSQIVVFVVGLILLLVLTIIVNKTKFGLSMKAVQQNMRAASLMGIENNRVITITFFLGGVTAAIGGALLGGYYQIAYPMMGAMLGLKAFAASVLGGIGVLYGSVIGGLIVGVIESLAATYLGGTYRDLVAFLILIIVLIIRPNGIFGKKTTEKV